MALYIRNDRALRLARRLAARKEVTITQAVIDALESALAREPGTLRERIQDIVREAASLSDPARRRVVTKEEVDGLWGHH